MTAHKELIERLRIVPTASQFLKVSDLFGELVDERAAAADALESQALEMEGLRKDAELWRWAITIGRDHRHNIFKAYDNWDGQDSFEDAAMAAKGGA